DPAALGLADVALPGGAADTDGPFGPQPGTGTASPVETAAATVLPRAMGAYSLVFMDEQTLYAARDPHGFRPLVLGRLDTGWVVASETAALDIVGARFVRRVAAGRRLAAEHPADADLVIPVPESGTPAAIGFAEASGIPFGQGLVKNSY